MAIAEPPQTSSNGSDPPISAISRIVAQAQQRKTTSIPRSPIISGQVSIQQPKLTGPASALGENLQEASPLPEKVGEIGYIPPARPARPPNLVTRDSLPQTELGVELSHPSQIARPVRPVPAWSPALSSSSHGHSPTRAGKPRERISALSMFLKPVLLAAFGVVVISLTFVGLVQVQERINNNNKNNRAKSASNNNDDPSSPNNRDDTSSEGTDGNSGGGNSASFVYMGTFFIVALLDLDFVGALRRLHHRLCLWVDQEYSTQIPDLSDPEATSPPPVLPLWAKILGIKPQAVRKPLLPSYMAVLGVIRNGGRAGTNPEGTGDVEDGEVIRTLAIGQGQAAPAFNGEEFQRSTVILSGPPKRNSTSPSVRSGGLLLNLSRTLTGGFGSQNSTDENVPPVNASRRDSVASVTSNGRRTSGAQNTIPEAGEHVSNEHSITIELSEVPLTRHAAYTHHWRRAA
ncbi:hypothetical protein PGTUg99_004955 [Puccinia graminis f. sp. tritici]|uniref:Uncharacterized protein n=1 Tax=Puccinia graminis f. sp. tritici TaxID=56615 RepID=A0A5B0LZP3_PUCGR|nr:hypothetical protein PGTUg99_004955 [Puccinia graminis f. sp. tritici]